MVHDATLPLHPFGYCLDFGEDVDGVTDDSCALRPQYPIHLQEDIGYITPEKFRKSILLECSYRMVS
jgi:hypothetical protein